jgi:hypothetical protein
MTITKPTDPQDYNYNYEAIIDPAVTNDQTEGFLVGATWINATSGEAFILVDNTPGAAIWTSLTAGGGGGGTPFSISSFSDGESATKLIGSGTDISSITFTASYVSPNPTSASVALITGTDSSGSFPIAMTGPTYTSSGAVAVTLVYPGSVGSVTRFRLTAAKSAENDTQDATITYLNQARYGVMSTPLPASGAFTQSNIDTFFTSTSLQNTLNLSYVAASGAGEKDVIAFRDALGTPFLFINGFLTDEDDRGTVSWTNANGFTETYHVFALPQENQTGAIVEWSSGP